MSETSFEKGENFENFVEKKLFSIKNFKLDHRTSSKKQNEFRYAEDTKKPDFTFECKESSEKFYVEAKFRSKFNSNNQLELMNESQFDRFNAIEYKEKTPIYLIVGYGGKSTNPEKISLIPLKKISQRKLTKSFIEKYNISPKFIKPEDLKLSEYFNENVEYSKESFNYKKFSLITGAAIVFIITSILLLNIFYNKNRESNKKLIEKPKPVLVTSKSTNEFYDLDEYGTTVEGVVKNIGYSGNIVVRVEVFQEGKKYSKSKKIFLRNTDSENFKIYFEETEFLKKEPTVQIKVFGVEN